MNHRPEQCGLHVVRFSALDGLAPLADSWNRLASGNPFRSWPWLTCWWRHFGAGTGAGAAGAKQELFVLGVFAPSGELAGLAPWYLEPSATQGRVVRFLGTGEVCSEYLSLLCEPGREAEVAAALAAWLVAASRSDRIPNIPFDRWDLLELTSVDAGDRPVALLAEQLRARGAAVHRRRGPDCWRFALPDAWEEYYARGSKSARRRLRRIEEPFKSGRAVLRWVESRAALPAFQSLLVELHQRRRRQFGQAGSFASPPFAAFHREVMGEMFDAGQLVFTSVELDGRPVVADYALVGSDRLYAYQAGVDPDRLDDSPGHLGNYALLREALRRKCRVFDFLRGDEPYKRLWGATPHATEEFRVVPDRFAARLRLGLWRAGSGLKQWARRFRRPAPQERQAPEPERAAP